MKRYALLTGLCFMVLVSSCDKDSLDTAPENIDLETVKPNIEKEKNKIKVDDWDRTRLFNQGQGEATNENN